ncbi:hypothetical protein [Streptomyces sp. NPDC056291]|uniref:hypothetical protein n=1 Tax=Streptomyces sp. NPDC056291 TaxID=3345772 RepID=UPI0035D76147
MIIMLASRMGREVDGPYPPGQGLVGALARGADRKGRAPLVEAGTLPQPAPIADPDDTARLGVRRSDRLDGVLHKYEHAS